MSTLLTVGSKGAEVGNWQRFLSELGYLDSFGETLVVDESYGAKTAWATKSYQAAAGLDFSGSVDEPTRALGQKQGFIPFIQALQCRVLWPAKRAKTDLVVIHTMENQEKPSAARNVAMWFAGKNSPVASAHFCLDDQETLQCVRETDVAFHAPGANSNGIGIEHAGYASQTPIQWEDDYSKLVLERSAQLAASLCKRWSIPVVRLSPSDLKAGGRGLCGHVDITMAFSGGRGHTDPGPCFGWDSYLARVKELSK